jgi:hypothetical protein
MKVTCQTILLSRHRPHRSHDDMSFRQSISEFGKRTKEKAKGKLSKIGNGTKRQGANVGGERLDRSTLSLQSEPAILVEHELGEGIGVGVGNDEPRPDDSPSVSPSMAELEREPGGSDDHTVRRERGQEGLHPHAHEQADGGSGQEREGSGKERPGQVDPPRSESDIGRRTPIPSILQDGGSKGTRTAPFQSLPLTDSTGDPAVPGPVRVRADTSKVKSEWSHTASSAAKLLLRTVKEASDAFPPLKSVAGGLCAILDNCEVQSDVVRLIHVLMAFPANEG